MGRVCDEQEPAQAQLAKAVVFGGKPESDGGGLPIFALDAYAAM